MAGRAGRVAFALAVAVAAGCAADRPAPVVDRSIGLAQRQPQQAPGEYRVVKGDTLYSIAFRYGMDFRTLARRNGIEPPYTIHPGQRLRLRPGEGEPDPGRTSPAAESAGGVTTEPLPERERGPRSRQEDRDAQAPAGESTEPPSSRPQSGEASGSEPEPEREAQPEPEPEPQPDPESGPEPGPLDWQWPADGPILSTFVAGDSSRNGIDIAGEPGTPIRAAAGGEVVYSGSGLIGYGELIIVKHDKALLSAYGHNRKRLAQEGDRVRAGQKIAEMGDTGAPRAMLHFEIRENGSPVNPERFLPRR